MNTIKECYSLKHHNTFGIDVVVERFIEYSSEDELLEIIGQIKKGTIKPPFLHIGSGSNLLFTADFPGTVLHSRIKDLEVLSGEGTLGSDVGAADVAGAVRTDDCCFGTVCKDAVCADDRSDCTVRAGGRNIGGQSVLVRVGAGYIWDDFVAYCVGQGWYGTENLSLIPGEVGASAVQNIGAYGVEAKDIIRQVETIDLHTGEKRIFTKSECGYSYRDSIFKRPDYKRYIVTYVVFALSLKEEFHLSYGGLGEELKKQGATTCPEIRPPVSLSEELKEQGIATLENVRRAVIALRDGKLPDPKVTGSAGSFFMNPIVPREKLEELLTQYPAIPHYPVPDSEDSSHVKISAGWLIQQSGWKGKSLGRAGVYSKQALVIVNHGGATGNEVLAVAQAVIRSVEEKFGITLRPEVNVLP